MTWDDERSDKQPNNCRRDDFVIFLFLISQIHDALEGAVTLTVLALLVFGYIKGRYTDNRPYRSVWQTATIGAVAAATTFYTSENLQLSW